MRRSKITTTSQAAQTKMPIYEYRCDNCGHELEAFQKLSEDPLRKCPECQTDALIKKISAAGFRLKGGGWYETDFKSGKKKNVSSSDDKSSSGDGASSSKSSTGAGGSDSGKAKASSSD